MQSLGNPSPPGSISRETRLARMGVALLFLLNGVLFATWVCRIPVIQEARGLSHGDLGLGLLGIALGALVAMPLTGMLMKRTGSRWAGIVSALLYIAVLPAMAAAPNGWLFYSVLFLFGATHGAMDIAMNSQAVLVEHQYRRPIMSSFHALFSGGGLAGAVVGAGIVSLGASPLLHFVVMASLLCVITMAGSFPFLLHDKPRPRAPVRLAAIQTAKSTKWGLPSFKLVLLGLVAFFCMLGEGAMADWGAIYLREAAGASESFAAIGYAAYSLTMMIGRLMGDRLSERFGPVQLIRYGGLLSVLGMVLALGIKLPLSGLIGFSMVGAGLATIVPLVISAAGRVGGRDPGMALATATTIGYFGFLIGPPLIGFMAELAGLPMALGIMLLTGTLLMLLAPQVHVPPPPAAERDEPSPPRETKPSPAQKSQPFLLAER